mmetsp:Transcript_7968/g.17092  ORF Transcript_7968/g.17092 Transcript_7968/m.17092 type:complete len:217 (+) Transcript_7968:39-689(+)
MKTFACTSPTLDLLSTDSPQWTDLFERNRSGQFEMYERVPPNQHLSRKRGVVCIDSRVAKKVPDSDVSKMVEQEQLNEQSLQVQVGDLAYHTDRCFVNALNKHLKECGSAEGDFYFISDAAACLSRLCRKQKVHKAAKFQGELDSFAKKYSISSIAFKQWQAVMDCKDVRDRMPHLPRLQGVESLREALDRNDPILEPCKEAVQAMIVLGQQFNVV